MTSIFHREFSRRELRIGWRGSAWLTPAKPVSRRGPRAQPLTQPADRSPGQAPAPRLLLSKQGLRAELRAQRPSAQSCSAARRRVIQNRRAQPTRPGPSPTRCARRPTARQVHPHAAATASFRPLPRRRAARIPPRFPRTRPRLHQLTPAFLVPFPLRLMYAFGLCISPQILRVAHLQRLFPEPCSLFPVPCPLHTHTRPVNLEIRGHAHFFGRNGCVPMTWNGIVGKQYRIAVDPRTDSKKL